MPKYSMHHLEVLTEPTFPLSLSEFKVHSNIQAGGTEFDAALTMYLKAAAKTFEYDTGFPVGVWGYRYTATHSDALQLPRHPVQAVSAVSSDGTPLVSNDHELTGNWFRLKTWRTGSLLTITFTAGTSVVPVNLKLAVFQLADHYYVEGSAQTEKNFTDTPAGYQRIVTQMKGH